MRICALLSAQKVRRLCTCSAPVGRVDLMGGPAVAHTRAGFREAGVDAVPGRQKV